MRSLSAILGLLLAAPLFAQLDERALAGEYRYVLLRYRQLARATALPAISSGAMSFDGAGGMNSGAFSGPYVVESDGRVAFASPADGARLLEGGLSPQLGLMTALSPASEAAFDLLVALAAPAESFDPASVSGSYIALVLLASPFDAAASLFAVAGFETSQSALSFDASGRGQFRFPASSGLGDLTFGAFATASGDCFAGAFDSAGVEGLFVAVRRSEAPPGSSLFSLEFRAGNGRMSAGWGPARRAGGGLVFGQRWNGPRGAYDYSGFDELSLGDGVGAIGSTPVASGRGGMLIGGTAGVAEGSFFLAHPAPPAAAADLDAAGFTSGRAAPGQLRTLFGPDLSREQAQAQSLPLPTELGGVSVLVGGRRAPLLFVSPGQVNYQVPEEAAGSFAAIELRSEASSVRFPAAALALSAPAFFTADGSGIGAAIVTHADFSLVTEQSPALPGEIVVGFLSGFGALAEPPEILVAGRRARVAFAGRAPGFQGLNQVNFEVPPDASPNPAAPLTIADSAGWSDLTTLPVGAR